MDFRNRHSIYPVKTLLTILLLTIMPGLLRAQGYVAKSAGTGSWKGIGTPGYVMRFNPPAAPPAGYLDSALFVLHNSVSVSGGAFIGNAIGEPSAGVITTPAGAVRTLTLTTIATGNWNPFGGHTSFAGNGIAGGTPSFLPAYSHVKDEFLYSDDTYDGTTAQFQIGNLIPGKHYDIIFYWSYWFDTTPGNVGITDYRVIGDALYGPVSINGYHNSSAAGTPLTFMSDGSGNAKVFMSKHAGSDYDGSQAFWVNRKD